VCRKTDEFPVPVALNGHFGGVRRKRLSFWETAPIARVECPKVRRSRYGILDFFVGGSLGRLLQPFLRLIHKLVVLEGEKQFSFPLCDSEVVPDAVQLALENYRFH